MKKLRPKERLAENGVDGLLCLQKLQRNQTAYDERTSLEDSALDRRV